MSLSKNALGSWSCTYFQYVCHDIFFDLIILYAVHIFTCHSPKQVLTLLIILHR